ncbi:MAG: hypothetical protein ACTS4T_00535 [Candidatus Hodgkinia cicadicola]
MQLRLCPPSFAPSRRYQSNGFTPNGGNLRGEIKILRMLISLSLSPEGFAHRKVWAMFHIKTTIMQSDCKHIEIRSNIAPNDLVTKINLIRRFVSKGYKVNVLAKFSKFATATAVYETFVNNLRLALNQIGSSVFGPTHFNGGSVAFCVIGMRSQLC